MSALLVALCLLFAPPAVRPVAEAAELAEAVPVAEAAEAAEAVPVEASVEVSRSGTEARMEGAAFGVTGLERLNKGTDKEYEGRYLGYRYPMVAEDAFAVVVIDERTALVYLPPSAAPLLPDDGAHRGFEAMLEALDEKVSNGGTMLKALGPAYEYTSERSVVRGAFRYSFAVEVEPGYYYVTVTGEGSTGAGASGASSTAGSAGSAGSGSPAGSSGTSSGTGTTSDGNGTGAALFCDTGLIVPVADVVIEQEPTGLAAIAEFFTSLDLRPFWVSLRTSAVAMLFVFVLGLLAAWYSQRIGTRLKGVLDSILTIPLVLPPTVCGFLLLVLFGNSTRLGRLLLELGIELIFSWPAAVLAAVVVSFPLMYRTARGAFEGLDPALGDAARTLGWSEPRVFFKLTMPLAWPSIAAGTVLAFARAMGEFGATLFVAGNYPGVTQTMPIAIYFEWMGGHSDVATFWVFVVILFSFVVILFVNWYASHTQRYRRASADETEADAPVHTSPVPPGDTPCGDGTVRGVALRGEASQSGAMQGGAPREGAGP